MKKAISTAVVLGVMLFTQVGLAQGPDEDLDKPIGSATDLLLTQGTAQAGGMIAFQIDAVKPSSGGSDGGSTLTVAPNVGFFIIDYLEIVGEIGFSKAFGDAHEYWGNPLDFTFGMGIKYYIPLGFVNIYAGALVGMGIGRQTFDDGMGERYTIENNRFMVTAPAGILLTLNRHVGLDLGVRFNFEFGLGDSSYDFAMNIPIGYFGVQGFFSFLN